ncbi:hypothetical protein PCE1_004228 [Barthelona sp. PCE]
MSMDMESLREALRTDLDEEYVDEHSIYEEKDIPTVLSTPHTITALFVGFAALAAYLFMSKMPETLEGQVFRAIKVICFGVVLFFVFQGKDIIFQRPHPVFWRCLNAVQLLYGCFMLFLAFMPLDITRGILNKIDPITGIETVAERDYMGDCSVKWVNIKPIIDDEFFFAHIIGWHMKALILRDYKMLWITSILFEFVELTFKHVLVNFSECWWDSWVIDVLLCNGLGIHFGMITCEYLSIKTFSWLKPKDRKKKEAGKSFVSRKINLVAPYSFTSYHWGMFESMRRFFGATLVMIMLEVVDLNAFWWKSILLVPTTHNWNLYRLLLWFLSSLLGAAELYEWATKRKAKLRQSAWLALFMVLSEILFIARHSGYLFIGKPKMYWKYWMWAVGLGLWVTYGAISRIRERRNMKKLKNE